MGNIRTLVKEIDRGVNRKKNLPLYATALADTYLHYAAIELTFSACILSESMADYDQIAPDETEMYKEVMELLRQVLEEPGEGSRSLTERAREIRKRITAAMETYTSYADHLVCYEYVLNRMLYKFCPDDEKQAEIKAINEDEFVRRLIVFAAGSKDKAVTMERCQAIVGQIPVHMTKNKLLERVSQAISLYRGSDKESLEGFAYMIRSVAMLHKIDGTSISDKRVQELVDELSHTDFSELEEATYSRLRERLEEMKAIVFQVTDFYYSLQKVINEIYAMCLARLHSEKKSGIYTDCMNILRTVADGEHQEEELEKLEGKIEEYVDRTGYLEAVLPEVRVSCQDVLEELGLLGEFEDYAVISSLLSDSLFVDLEKTYDDAVVDDEMAERVSGELTGELSELLGGLPKALKRAVIALILERLPVTFQNVSEIEDYIRTNLFGCQDFSERSVAITELNEMMMESEAWETEWSGRNDFLV